MEVTLRRIDGIEAELARTPAENIAELHLKLGLLFLDGELRPEFRDNVMADIEADAEREHRPTGYG